MRIPGYLFFDSKYRRIYHILGNLFQTYVAFMVKTFCSLNFSDFPSFKSSVLLWSKHNEVSLVSFMPCKTSGWDSEGLSISYSDTPPGAAHVLSCQKWFNTKFSLVTPLWNLFRFSALGLRAETSAAGSRTGQGETLLLLSSSSWTQPSPVSVPWSHCHIRPLWSPTCLVVPCHHFLEHTTSSPSLQCLFLLCLTSYSSS